MTPDQQDLWFLPLGGCGEIGMNLNLYGHDGHWLMVDCGVTFPRPGEPGARSGADRLMADPAFILDNRERLSGLVVTHAHEDHIGAVPLLWPLLKCPVYTSRFTAEILRRKLAEFGLEQQVPIFEVAVDERRQIGPFEVQWLALTHSIPDPNALMIRTPAGTLFHSGDWKLDDHPVLGHGYSPETFQALGDEGVDAMVCDSTNALVAGRTQSEGELHRGLLEVVDSAPGRVVVCCFGSNIARLHTLARVARETGRYMGLLGRSLSNMASAARAADLWDSRSDLIEPSHLGYLPAREVLAVATGSQGEPRTALHRLAADNHPDLTLEPGDRVVFSARAIPGNEDAIQRVVDRLREREVEVITADDTDLPIHASGHPAADELQLMYQWVRPRVAIPVHGEAAHMAANAGLAQAVGVPKQLVGQNGDLFMVSPVAGVRRQAVQTGRWGLVRGALTPLT